MTDHAVGLAALAVSSTPGDRLLAHALGSCLGVAVHDPVAGVGGLLHVMLPRSGIDRAEARENPARFVDTGVPALFRACYAHGAEKHRMIVKVAGGASATAPDEPDRFRIGRRNLAMLHRLLAHNGLRVHAQAVGGHQLSRTLALHVGDGTVTLRTGTVVTVL